MPCVRRSALPLRCSGAHSLSASDTESRDSGNCVLSAISHSTLTRSAVRSLLLPRHSFATLGDKSHTPHCFNETSCTRCRPRQRDMRRVCSLLPQPHNYRCPSNGCHFARFSLSTMSRPAVVPDVVSSSAPSYSLHHKRRKRRRSATSTSQPSLPLSLSSAPASSFTTLLTSSGRTITPRRDGRVAGPVITETPSGSRNRTVPSTASFSSAFTPAVPSTVGTVDGFVSSSTVLVDIETDAARDSVAQPITLHPAAPLPAVVVLSVTSPVLALSLPALLASASSAVSLLPVFNTAPTQKLTLHSLFVSSQSQSMLITFSSLPPTSPLPQPLVGLLSSSTVALLMPTKLSRRQFKAALSAWQRPHNFTLSKSIEYVTPFLLDLLSLSPSTAPSIPAASVSWPDCSTQLPPSDEDRSAVFAYAAFAAHQLRLYQHAHAISTEFTAFATEQLQHIHAFNLRFVPLLPVSPYRFTLDSHVEAAFPLMQLPIKHRVIITSNHAEAERAIAHLLGTLPSQQQPPMIGFDTESRPMFVAGQPNRPISLVQLSSLSVSVLCRVKRRDGLPPALVRVLVDPKVRKVGQGIGGDMRLLYAQYRGTEGTPDAMVPETLLSSPSSHSLIDLESLSSQFSIHRIGLASLTASFLSLRLSKAAQLSNWERQILTNEQISYAALDSLVSLKLAQRLQRVRDDLQIVSSGWVERERARNKAGGAAVVNESTVWRWLTGKPMSAVKEVQEDGTQASSSSRKQNRQRHTVQQAPDVRPQHDGNEQQRQQHEQARRHDRRPPTAQLAASAAQPPTSSGSQQPRKPRYRRVSEGSGGANQEAVEGNSGGSSRVSNAPSIVARL